MQPKKSKMVYLASASPRRAELLSQIGVSFDVIRVDVDESHLATKSLLSIQDAKAYVVRLAIEKAKAGHDCVIDKSIPVLGADTAIYISETANTPAEILGKPRTFQDAHRMMALLSGRTHQVLTAVALVGKKCGEGQINNHRHLFQEHIVQISDVTLRKISDAEIEAYWETGEPQDKAGGYAIQGKAAVFISKIEGSYSGVMGLPIFETANLIASYNNEKK